MSLRNLYKKIIKQFTPGYKCLWVDDIPDKIKRNIIYIVGMKSNPWVLVFTCPCGCRNLVYLNLLPGSYPRWTYKISFSNRVSISPSVKRISGCKSHFHIKKGRIIWSIF